MSYYYVGLAGSWFDCSRVPNRGDNITLFRRQKQKKKQISYSIKNTKIFQAPVHISGIDVKFNNTCVNSLYQCKILIINSGNIGLKIQDLDDQDPLCITWIEAESDGENIFHINPAQLSREGSKLRLHNTLDSDALGIDWHLLNPGDYGILSFLHSGGFQSIKLEGIIVGAKTNPFRLPEIEPKELLLVATIIFVSYFYIDAVSQNYFSYNKENISEGQRLVLIVMSLIYVFGMLAFLVFVLNRTKRSLSGYTKQKVEELRKVLKDL